MDVDGSEIPRPTTVWMVRINLVNNGISTTNLTWCVDPGFQTHQQLDVGLEVIARDIVSVSKKAGNLKPIWIDKDDKADNWEPIMWVQGFSPFIASFTRKSDRERNNQYEVNMTPLKNT